MDILNICKGVYHSVSFGCFAFILFVFVLITYNGLNTGTYQALLCTNILGEHYIELTVLCLGFVSFLVIAYHHFKGCS